MQFDLTASCSQKCRPLTTAKHGLTSIAAYSVVITLKILL